jgi:hypothetical protein
LTPLVLCVGGFLGRATLTSVKHVAYSPRNGTLHYSLRRLGAMSYSRMVSHEIYGNITFVSNFDITVAEHFEETWKALVPCPEVRSIFKIQQSRAFLADFETYQYMLSIPLQMRNMFNVVTRIAENEQLRKSASDTASNRRWHGITRECNLGDSGMQDLCFSPKCLLCSVIQTSFRDAKAGIYTSTASSRCVVLTPQVVIV